MDYTEKSGRSAMIPKWSLGFWMSKMSYMTRKEVENVVNCAESFGMSMPISKFVLVNVFKSIEYP